MSNRWGELVLGKWKLRSVVVSYAMTLLSDTEGMTYLWPGQTKQEAIKGRGLTLYVSKPKDK